MNDDSSDNSKYAYENLLSFFAGSSSHNPPPISHPDHDVNEQAQKEKSRYRKAAVLIPVTRQTDCNESEIVLTVRSKNLRSHAGQISLPGGTKDASDSSFEHTALRESEEEIGLKPERVKLIGKLGDMALPSGFEVTPFVGLIEHGQTFTPSPDEVADIFQVPTSLILSPAAYTRSTMRFDKTERVVLELVYEGYRIWGATAAILYHLAKKVSAENS